MKTINPQLAAPDVSRRSPTEAEGTVEMSLLTAMLLIAFACLLYWANTNPPDNVVQRIERVE